MRELTKNQKDFILKNFFKNPKYNGWESIATKLLETGTCVVAGYDCIWKGGIGNFIETSKAEDFIDCVRYNFDTESFLKSKYYIESSKPIKDRIGEELERLNNMYTEINRLDIKNI